MGQEPQLRPPQALLHKYKAELSGSGMMGFWNPKACHQGHTSSNKADPPNSSQTVPSAGDHSHPNYFDVYDCFACICVFTIFMLYVCKVRNPLKQELWLWTAVWVLRSELVLCNSILAISPAPDPSFWRRHIWFVVLLDNFRQTFWTCRAWERSAERGWRGFVCWWLPFSDHSLLHKALISSRFCNA